MKTNSNNNKKLNKNKNNAVSVVLYRHYYYLSMLLLLQLILFLSSSNNNSHFVCHSWSFERIFVHSRPTSKESKQVPSKMIKTTTTTTLQHTSSTMDSPSSSSSSPPPPPPAADIVTNNNNNNNTRRQWFHQIMLATAAVVTSTTITSSSSSSTTSTWIAHAACLPGDLSKECIGVYKVPIDDAVLPYVSTPEALKQFAPDLKYVPPIESPSIVSEAFDIFQAQRLAADDIQTVVLRGQLEEAGIKVLNLVPKITSSGRAIIKTIATTTTTSNTSSNSQQQQSSSSSLATVNALRMEKLQDSLDLALGLWGECDVMIGQGIRGEMGVSAVAQIQILTSIKEATAALDDFLALAKASLL